MQGLSSLRNMGFSFVADSFGDSTFPSSICFGSQPGLSLNVSRVLSYPVCLMTHPEWAGSGRHLPGQSLTLGDAPAFLGDAGRSEQTGFKGFCPRFDDPLCPSQGWAKCVAGPENLWEGGNCGLMKEISGGGEEGWIG